MENLTSRNQQTDEFSEKSEEGYLLPAPDSCSDRIVRICRYGLYAFVVIAIAAILLYAAKGLIPESQMQLNHLKKSCH